MRRSRDRERHGGAPAPPSALTCDLWYTLLYFRPRDRDEHARRRRAAWTDRLVRAGLERARADAGYDRLIAWGRSEEAKGRTPPIAEQRGWLAAYAHVPTRALDGVAEELDRSLLRAHPRRAPGLLPALDRLADRGVALGIVSNILFETGAASRKALEATGLAGRFGAVVLSSEVPWSKPAPEPFERCLAMLSASARRAVHIGDLAYDVVGARRAGLGAILYSGLHRFERPPPPIDVGRLRPARAARWSEVPGLCAARFGR